MTGIFRNPETGQREHYDIIVVGGGIYGAMLLLQAAEQGQKVLLLERNDFGAETSFNSLRIIHGGLRYLQSFDLPRFYESVRERHWFLQTFPELVKPMPCLMPLYNKGAKRPEVFKVALRLNDLLSTTRNRQVLPSHEIENGRILSVAETREKFPGVADTGLTGSALWYDAHAPDTQRIIMETLKWACAQGGKAFNYMEVTDVLKSGNKAVGVQATDHLSDRIYEFRSEKVINATGPFSRSFSRRFDRDIPNLFWPSKAWNVLFDIPAPSDCALALTPDRKLAQTYFLHPWKGRLLAGTGHAPIKNSTECDSCIEAEVLESFVHDMDLIMPDMALSVENIERVYSGCLPVVGRGDTSLTKRAVFCDHGAKGGIKGLYSISGIKFTTARREAEKALKHILGKDKLSRSQRPTFVERPAVSTVGYDWMPSEDDTHWKTEIKKLIDHESVVHLDDLLYRRTSIGDNSNRVRALANEIAELFDWGEQRMRQEVSSLMRNLQQH